jgi:hypothetical protein
MLFHNQPQPSCPAFTKAIIRIMAARKAGHGEIPPDSCLINGKITSHGKERSHEREGEPSIVDFDKDFQSEIVFSVVGMRRNEIRSRLIAQLPIIDGDENLYPLSSYK